MSKKIKYELSEEELEIIEKAIKQDPRPKVRRRAPAIRLLHLGYKPAEAGKLLSASVSSIYRWHDQWRENGVDGVDDKPRSGRPKVTTEEYCQKLEKVMAKDPHELGYVFTIWTVARLEKHMKKETGIEMSEETLRQLLKEKGYVYRRPKHDMKPLQDQEGQQRASVLLDELKKKQKQESSNYAL